MRILRAFNRDALETGSTYFLGERQLRSETASVTGRVDKETLCTLIDTMGYKAHSLDSLAQRQILIVHEKKRLVDARRRAVLATVLSLPVMMIGMAMPASRVLALGTAFARHAHCAVGGMAVL